MPPNDPRPAKTGPRPRPAAPAKTGDPRAPSKRAPTSGQPPVSASKGGPPRAAARPPGRPPGRPPAPAQAQAQVPAPIGPGSVLDGRYRLEQVLGSGGMSTVYAGTHERTGGKLAIKLLDPRLSGKADMHQRCLQEARAMMDISSNHVVRAYDVGETATGQVYIVMEYLDGEDLDHTLQREGPLPWSRIPGNAIQKSSGLSSAHNKGTFHRDIKPQNCFRVTLDRNPDHIKLIDFGIAKDTNSDQELTQDGVLLGTPEYMAPELIATNASPDARSDIYAVGATLYKLLTGTPPFASKNVLDLLYHQKHTAPDPPSQRLPEREIPQIADLILLRALEKDPDKRFQSADEFGQALIEAIDVPAGVQRHMSQPFLPAIQERSRPGTTPLGTLAPRPSASGATPIGTPTLDGTESATVDSAPAIRDEVSRSQQYDTDAPRPASLKDVGARAGTLLSIALVFGLASWVAAPAPSPDDVLAATADPEDADAEAEVPLAPLEPPPILLPPEPSDSPPAAPPAADDIKLDDPGDDIKLDDAPVPEDIKVEDPPAEEAPADATKPAPDPDFGYRSAEKELREQNKFLQNCLDDAGQGAGRVKFTIEVRKSGMPRHKIRVFSSSAAVRACVRGLFDQFPFDPSPRGGAFSYTYSKSRASFARLPLSTPNE